MRKAFWSAFVLLGVSVGVLGLLCVRIAEPGTAWMFWAGAACGPFLSAVGLAEMRHPSRLEVLAPRRLRR